MRRGKAMRSQPVGAALSPTRQYRIIRIKPEAARAALVEAQFVRHAGFAERGGKPQAVFDRHRLVVDRVNQTSRRRLFMDHLIGAP